jgi:quinol monooxygenase YgiN
MICVVASLETAAGRREDLLRLMEKLVPQVRAEKGCLEYGPMVDVATQMNTVRPNVVTMIEKWESVAALQAHLATPHMVGFRTDTADMGLSMSLQILEPA